jgi:hypothetical protein
MQETEKRGFLLSKAWIQAVILVFLLGFFILGFLAYRTYIGEPPIPGKVVDSSGRILFTRADIMAGQGLSCAMGGGPLELEYLGNRDVRSGCSRNFCKMTVSS